MPNPIRHLSTCLSIPPGPVILLLLKRFGLFRSSRSNECHAFVEDDDRILHVALVVEDNYIRMHLTGCANMEEADGSTRKVLVV